MQARLLPLFRATLILALFGASLMPAASAPPETGPALASPSALGVFAGQAQDLLTGQPVSGALVHLEGLAVGTHTDSGGHYRLLAPPGTWNWSSARRAI